MSKATQAEAALEAVSACRPATREGLVMYVRTSSQMAASFVAAGGVHGNTSRVDFWRFPDGSVIQLGDGYLTFTADQAAARGYLRTASEADRREFGRRASEALERFRLGIYVNGAAVGVFDDFGNLQLPNSDGQQVYEERNCFAYPHFVSSRPA